jgi:hypothetical protein
MRCRRSILLGLALAAFQFTSAAAQTAPPWTGIAADEAKVDDFFHYGSHDMSPRSISADGRFVVFHSNSYDLVPNDTNNANDVFLRDRVTRELTRVSVSSAGVEGNSYSAYPSISADGRHISFYSCASNLDPLDTNDRCDFFVRDRELGTTVRVSLGPNDEQFYETAFYQARLSGDGRFVVFSGALAAQTESEVWLRDRDSDANGVFDEPGTSTTTRISPDSVNDKFLINAIDVAISNDARFIAWTSETCDPLSTCIGYRVYVHDRVTTQSYRIDRPSAGYFDENAYSFAPDFSDSGLVAYSSNQPNLVEGHVNFNGSDIYVFNLITGGNTLVQLTHPNAPVLNFGWTPAITADGRYVAFMGASYSPPYYAYEYNVYAVDRQANQSYELSVHWDGTRDNNASAPSISADGSAIAFAADAGMIFNNCCSSRGVFVVTNVGLSPADTDVPETGGSYTIELTAPATTSWQLEFWGNATPNPSSGTGSATIEITIPPNTTPDDQELLLLLGSEQAAFHQTSPPRIEYTMPYYGPPSGGTDVDIYGSGFAEGMTVEFGGAMATNVTFVDNHHIVATTPAHQGGWVSIKVTKASGSSAELLDMFYYDDTTPPIITPHVTGTLGANGWYTSDVTVTWTVVEDDSAILASTCDLPFSQTTDVELVFAICYAESFGGESFSDVEVRRDTTPPTVVLGPPYGGETYAQGQQIPLALYCDDETSGVNPVNCTSNQAGPYVNTSTVGSFVLSGTAVDMAGHTTTTSVNYTVKMLTALTVPVATAVYGGANALLSATLVGPSGGLAGKTITFFVDNTAVGTATTAANGEAILSFPISGRNAGSYEMHAEFAEDATAFGSMLSSALNIDKATPVVTWANPSFIVTTTPLGSTQLNATASIPGSFVYTPGFWALLPAGTQTLSVEFTPQDASNYLVVTKTVTIKVKAIPVITWPAPAAITYPTFLTGTQLNATANVAGNFVYTPAFSALLDTGTQTLSVTFTPTNTADYVVTSSTTTIEVLKGTATINWPYIDPIIYGTALTGLQLNATHTAIGGTITYSPPYGTVLNAGTQTLTATFNPDSPYNYYPATATREILVGKAYPPTYWPGDLAPIVYGTPLGAAQLYATSPIAGTITYNPPAGTVLDAGLRTITMTFTPDDTANYHTVSFQKQIAVDKQTTTVTWNSPAPIVYGTALGAAQLTATGSVPGTFTYTPSAGTVLNAGTHTLSVYFTPTSSNYYGGSWTTTLIVAKRTPTIAWNTPAPITYGTALSNTQLNASANTAGTFSYSPAAATVLGAGTQTLSVTFEPSDPANNNAAAGSTTIVVNKATPVITWPDQGHITYGTPLSGSQLNATANVPGTFAYSPDFGAVLPAGNYTLSTTFTPTDSANYASASDTALLAVFKQLAVVTWPAPAPIDFGTPLSATQLNATANVPGTFTYIPPAGTIVGAGTPTLYVNFTPDDTDNYYGPGSVGVTLQVNRATPVISWTAPSSIAYGTALSSAQLNATANVPGTFAYSPGTGTVLPGGSHTLSVTFTPSDTTDYTTASASVGLEVTKITPVITWSAPPGITYGTLLDSSQLNAAASVPGSFTYSPPEGTILGAGGRTLTVTFTPDNLANYNAASASVSIAVEKATPAVSWNAPADIVYGTALSAYELNATANVPGTLTYSPAAGTVLGAGPRTLSVTFTPDDAANYNGATASVTLNVTKAESTLTWPIPGDVVYGTALSASQLNATANVAGMFNYSPGLAAILGAGPQTLTVTFTPDDAANYNEASASVLLNVTKAAPTITWPAPGNIVYGTALSASQLNATSNVPGTLVYLPATGAVLSAGPQTLQVTFTPDDAANYTGVTVSVSLTVTKATPTITWQSPGDIVYGTALNATQLNATANVTGSFAYSPASGSVLNAGSNALSVTFTPSDSMNYDAATANVSIIVNQAPSIIFWSNPAGITYGTPLSAAQNNATANVPGTFTYAYPAGTVLDAGNRPLSVAFTPTDAANYLSALAIVSISIAPAPLTVQTNNATKVYGAALPAFTASGTGFVNGDSMASLTGTLSFSTSATATSAPGTYPVTPSGVSSANYTVTFANGTLTVTKASTALTLTTTPNPSNNNQQVQLRAVVAAVAPGAGTPGGTVEFRENGTLLGTATLVNGVATMNKSFKRGTHPLTATYVGNTNFNGSSGSVTHQTN